MIEGISRYLRRHPRRAIGVALSPALVMLAVDAWIAHFAGKEPESALQSAPVVYGAIGAAALLIAAVPRLGRIGFVVCCRIAGGAGALVGIAGAALHAQAFFRELNGERSWAAVEGALAVAPPIFAPAAFAGVGALIWALASPSVFVRLGAFRRTRGPRAEVISLRSGRDERRLAAGRK